MNKAKLKAYAPQARKDFIAAVTARANLLGLSEKAGELEVVTGQTQGDAIVIAGQAWPLKVGYQRQQLIARIKKDGFAQTMEAVAYTWFNRFAALRYMELHDYLSHGHRALSSQQGKLPDILTHAADLTQDSRLPGLKAALVTEMKLSGNRDGELYRMLLVAQCNALSAAMPFLFERIDDETELLLPDNLLRTDSVIAKMVGEIDEDDWNQVEIIGWLYQFYIAEKKEEVIGKVVESEDIPAATQLFTPKWIVQYLVQNTLGRLWLTAHPHSTLREKWHYYIDPAEQTPEVQTELNTLIHARMNEDGGSLSPETITLLDPACGSGHILVEAYEVLKSIYLERGYQPRSIPRLILEKNLFGLDIDDRAAQMAGFSLLMKARADDRRLFDEPIDLKVLSLQDAEGLDVDELTRALRPFLSRAIPTLVVNDSRSEYIGDELFPRTPVQSCHGQSIANGTQDNCAELSAIVALISIFINAKTYGSLIQIPPTLNAQLSAIEMCLKAALENGDLYAKAAARELFPLLSQAQVLGIKFDAVVENPPYMGSQFFNPDVKKYLSKYHANCDKDLFSAFISRSALFCKASGVVGVVTSFTWMFISSFEGLRKEILRERTLSSLIQLEYDAFEDAKAHLCTFVFNAQHIADYIASFIRLSDFKGANNQGPKTLEALSNRNCGWFYNTKTDNFWKIPGSPISYWLSSAAFSAFEKFEKIGDFGRARIGMATGKNDLYVRYWHEVSFNAVGLGLTRETAKVGGRKWFPYAKGGGFRRWYGNVDVVVNWEDDGNLLRNTLHPLGKRLWAHNFNLNEIFKPAVCWNVIASTENSFRYHEKGFLFDSAAGLLQCTSPEDNYAVLGLLNSKVSSYLLPALNPTINLPPGYLEQMPAILSGNAKLVSELIGISRADWNLLETSWGFEKPPILSCSANLESAEKDWRKWQAKSEAARLTAAKLETENNRHFIHAYGLENTLSADVSVNEITLLQADRQKDCQRLVSYAIGCMMGRYSLDAPGVIYADARNVGFDEARYTKFPADVDGILPLTDEIWFEDDAASRVSEFIATIWGQEALAENITWLAEGVGAKTSETPDEAIRRYLVDKFYKDHLQAYKKRPIYWLFSSGKQGAFQALIYLHRYHEGTVARLRAEYVVPLTGRMQSRIDMLEKDAAVASSAARNKLLKQVEKLRKKHVELLAYDEQLRHYADMRIALDLDDGVKVNYGKFGNLLAEVKAVTGGGSDD
jgi:hypothetical protein